MPKHEQNHTDSGPGTQQTLLHHAAVAETDTNHQLCVIVCYYLYILPNSARRTCPVRAAYTTSHSHASTTSTSMGTYLTPSWQIPSVKLSRKPCSKEYSWPRYQRQSRALTITKEHVLCQAGIQPPPPTISTPNTEHARSAELVLPGYKALLH